MSLAASVASSLYGSITGEAISSLKRAQRTARLIEEDLIAEGWPVGKRYGSEQQIAERFSIGRCAAREAIRILQLRGSIKMQRGPGGGMVVAAPSIDQVIRNACDHFVIVGVTVEQLIEARCVLLSIAARLAARTPDHALALALHVGAVDEVAHDEAWEAHVAALNLAVAELTSNAAIVLFVRCVEQLLKRLGGLEVDSTTLSASVQAERQAWREQSVRLIHAVADGNEEAAFLAAQASMQAWQAAQDKIGAAARAAAQSTVSVPYPLMGLTRAERVARELAAERHGDCAEGKRLGSEFELCERYGVSRFVMRQAIRILEDTGTVISQRGRGRGLMVRQPQPGPTIRLLCGYLFERSMTIHQDWEVAEQLSVELARLAASRVTAEDAGRLERMIVDIGQWHGPVEWLPHLDAEREAGRIARNPVLDLFLLTAKAFGSWAGRHEQGFPSNCIDEYPHKAIAVMRAISNRDASGAATAELRKQRFLLERVWSVPHTESCTALPPQANPRSRLFARVYAESHEVLRRWVARFVDSTELANGIVQEAYRRTYAEADSIETPHAFLFSTIRNLAWQHRFGEAALQSQNLVRVANPCDETSMLSAADFSESWLRILEQAIDQLPDDCRMDFTLQVLRECSYQAILDRLGQPSPPTVQPVTPEKLPQSRTRRRKPRAAVIR